MSKAITIQQKGVAQNITVDKLQVHKAGGTAYWVPEDTVELHALTATTNGEYSAASAGKYGYGYASVSVPGSSVTGTGSDGNQHVITTDGSGAIVDTKVPSEIRIITPPDYVGPYGDGAYISFEGLTVEAFYADGTSAGMIDPQDLSFPVTVARYDTSEDIEIHDPQGINMLRLSKTGVVDLGGWGKFAYDSRIIGTYVGTVNPSRTGRNLYAGNWSENEGFSIYMTVYNGAAYFMAVDEASVKANYCIIDYNPEEDAGLYGTVGTAYLHRFTKCVDNPNNPSWDFSGLPVSTTDPLEADMSAYTGAMQEIPVQYSRPGDGLVLEDSFMISVVPGPSGGDDT